MKMQIEYTARPRQRGMATVVFMALLAIMMILVTAETRALIQLRREVKYLQQQQIKRLELSKANPADPAQPETKK